MLFQWLIDALKILASSDELAQFTLSISIFGLAFMLISALWWSTRRKFQSLIDECGINNVEIKRLNKEFSRLEKDVDNQESAIERLKSRIPSFQLHRAKIELRRQNYEMGLTIIHQTLEARAPSIQEACLELCHYDLSFATGAANQVRLSRSERYGSIAYILDASQTGVGDMLAEINALRAANFEAEADYDQAAGAWDSAYDFLAFSNPSDGVRLLELFIQRANSINDGGMYHIASVLFRRIVIMVRRHLGEGHIATLTTENNLATVYNSLGRHAEAAPLFEEILQYMKKLEKTNEEKQPRTSRLVVQNNLGTTYNNLNRHEEAKILLAEALKFQKHILGRHHQDALTTQSNLASTYDSLHQYRRAISLFTRTLAGQMQVLGPRHLDTLTTQANLAATYNSVLRHKEAAAVYREVVKMRKKILPPEHPDLLAAQGSLGITYLKLKRYWGARKFLSKTTEIQKRSLGLGHPQTVITQGSLAELYSLLGKYDEAETLYGELLDLPESILKADARMAFKAGLFLATLGKRATHESEPEHSFH